MDQIVEITKNIAQNFKEIIHQFLKTISWYPVLKILSIFPMVAMSLRIPTVKLKIPKKSIFEIRNQDFCYIQVKVFDLSYLPVRAVGT